jgi:hypothetical protein
MPQQLSEKDQLQSQLRHLREECGQYERLLSESIRSHVAYNSQGARCMVKQPNNVLRQEDSWRNKIEELEAKIAEVEKQLGE